MFADFIDNTRKLFNIPSSLYLEISTELMNNILSPFMFPCDVGNHVGVKKSEYNEKLIIKTDR
jgi:hypothetical protein